VKTAMKFFAQLTHLSEILGFVGNQARQQGVDPAKLQKVELAAEEAVVNIINYAYQNDECRENTVVVMCDRGPEGSFVITFRDQGCPFNPKLAETVFQDDEPIETRKVGGLGIFLMKEIVDEIEYERVGGENVLKLIFSAA